jgi:hypothetical protein
MTISLCLVSLLLTIRPSLGLLLPSPLPSPSLLPIPLKCGTTTIEGTGSTYSSRLRCNNSNNKSKSSRILLSTTTTTTTLYNSNQDKEEEKEKSASSSSIFSEDDISNFCKGTNAFWKGLVIEPVRNYVEIRPATGTTPTTGDIFSKLIAPPEVPGIPRPVWFTILGSVPTGLGWYGYYKFSVEEELFQHELQTDKDGNVSGCGGYGTLFPFVYGIIIGFPMSLLHIPGGEFIIQSAAIWILAGQVNLYRRVNELCFEDENIKNEILGGGGYKEDGDNDENDNDEPLQPPLHAWWALLPPPLDVVVGLRQVHFLSEYWRVVRGEPYNKDVIAEELFPFISSKRFTLKEFVRKPSNWFWFTKKWKDLDNIDFLKD